MSFDRRQKSDCLLSIDYDRSIWVPVPLEFPSGPWSDAAEWAFESAGDCVLRSGYNLSKEVVVEEVLPLSQRLLLGRYEVVGKVPGLRLYLHCPDSAKMPSFLSIGLWRSQGTREEALRYYSMWGSVSADSVPSVDDFSTEVLGCGLRSSWASPLGVQVNYFFRDDLCGTDLHVYAVTPEPERLGEFNSDLDAFVRGLGCVPRPSALASP
jgi:hypothetical protein